jgi:hypothetical protein
LILSNFIRDYILHSTRVYNIRIMPRPIKLQEEVRKLAWETAHPKIAAVPEKPPISKTAKFTRAVLASSPVALFIGSVYAYFSLAGVVDSMNAARLILILGGIALFAGILVSEMVWGKSRKFIIRTAIGTGMALSMGLWSLDKWTVRYRIAHTPPLPVALLPPVAPKEDPCAPMFEFKDSKNIEFESDNLHTCGQAIKADNVDNLKMKNTKVHQTPKK